MKLGEVDASLLSMYKLDVDNRQLGKFKSSGILVSTGTGSSGWLYAAKATSPHTVAHFRELIGMGEKQKTNKVLKWQDNAA